MTEIEPELPELSAEGRKRVQQVVGTLLFYSRQVTAIRSIAAEQNNSTSQAVAMLLDYAATNPDSKIRFRRSDMGGRLFYLGEENVDKTNGP
eukprot:13081418-Ditylum_brightwellii.AAC.1